MPLPKDPVKAQLWKERQRNAQLGKSRNKGEKAPMFGKHHSDETKKKLSDIFSGKNNPMFGKTHTDEVRLKIGIIHKGKIGYWKGKHLSNQAKQIISEKAKARIRTHGRRNTPEQRLNISNGTKVHALRGTDHPRWKGGISPENQRARYSFEMKEWRRKVFERDNYTCRQCGYSKGKILIAHHIKLFSKFPEFRLDVVNGITLCKHCHDLIPSE